MRPGTYNLALYRGDTYAWKFVLYTSSGGTTQPSDLTGVVAKAEIRRAPAGQVLAALDCSITLPNEILMKLTTDLWSTLSGDAYWDLQLTYPDADASVVTVLAGTVKVTPDITDSAPVAAMAAPMSLGVMSFAAPTRRVTRV